MGWAGASAWGVGLALVFTKMLVGDVGSLVAVLCDGAEALVAAELLHRGHRKSASSPAPLQNRLAHRSRVGTHG